MTPNSCSVLLSGHGNHPKPGPAAEFCYLKNAAEMFRYEYEQ